MADVFGARSVTQTLRACRYNTHTPKGQEREKDRERGGRNEREREIEREMIDVDDATNLGLK